MLRLANWILRRPMIIVAVILVLFFSFTTYYESVMAPRTAAAREILVSEIALINPMPNAVLSDSETFSKTGSVVIFETYLLQGRNCVTLRQHYDPEMARNGWSLLGERPMLDWGKPYGTRAVYCKGGYEADLRYPYSEADGPIYHLRLSWNAESDCPRRPGPPGPPDPLGEVLKALPGKEGIGVLNVGVVAGIVVIVIGLGMIVGAGRIQSHAIRHTPPTRLRRTFVETPIYPWSVRLVGVGAVWLGITSIVLATGG